MSKPESESKSDRKTYLSVYDMYKDPLIILKTSGQFCYDSNGKEYLDLYNNVYHVGYCNHRKRQAPGLAGRRIDLLRADCAHAAAQHIGTDDEIFVGIENPSRAHAQVPPA